MVLIGKIITPVTLTYRFDKRLNTIVTRMQTTAKATTHGVPGVIENFVPLVVEHCRHFLPLRCHQHRRDIDSPTMRNQENNLFIVTLHLIDDFPPFPVDAAHQLLWPT